MPVNHEYFKETNLAQWYWYLYNFVEDQDEDFTVNRNLIEYHASFLEPEIVAKTRQHREQEKLGSNNEAFRQSIKNMFGKDITFNGQVSSNTNLTDVSQVSSILDRVTSIDEQTAKIKTDTISNYDFWLNFDLE